MYLLYYIKDMHSHWVIVIEHLLERSSYALVSGFCVIVIGVVGVTGHL